MKKTDFLSKLSVILVMTTLLLLTGCSKKSEKTESVILQKSAQDEQAIPAGPIDIVFGKLWPFPEGVEIQYYLSDNNRTMTINGNYNDAFGLTWEREFNLNGNRTLEVRILDIGNSLFYSDEINPGEGNGKMLKVIVYKEPGGSDFTLICNDPWKRANDPEFVMKNTGKLEYSLKPLESDAIYKLGFVFFKARVNGLQLRARFTH